MGGASSEVRRAGETKTEMFERFGQSDKIKPQPELPACVEHVVGWFFELSSRRGAGMSGGLPITWEAIKAWKELLNIEVSEEEIRMILAMDSAFLKAADSDSETEEAPPPTSVLLRK